MGIVTEYLTLQKQFQQQYGDRTILLLQLGTFYEIYQFDPNNCSSEAHKTDDSKVVWNEPIGHAVELSPILNITLTCKDGNEPYSIKNPHMIGFPTIAYEKYKLTLLANDFIIVRMDQGLKDEKGKVTRYVSEVVSANLEIDAIPQSRTTSNIVCIYIEHQGKKSSKLEDTLITAGIAVIDIITGSNKIAEYYSKTDDSAIAVQELFRFLIVHYPKEIIIHLSDFPTDEYYKSYLEKVLELRRFDRVFFKTNEVITDFKKLSYQTEFLNKIYTSKNVRNDSIIHTLGLEYLNYGRISYLLLLQYLHTHKLSIITKLPKPDVNWIDANKHLILAHNAILQLNVLSNNKSKEIDSLMSILDYNCTNLGKRLLATMLENPLYKAEEIQVYYDMVDEMIRENTWQNLDTALKELPDIARLHRKLEIKAIIPRELALLYKSYLKIIAIYTTVLSTNLPTIHSQLLSTEQISMFNTFIQRYSSLFDFDSLETCNINDNSLEFTKYPLKQGYFPELDNLSKQLTTHETTLQQIIEHLNFFLQNTKGQKIVISAMKKKRGAIKQEATESVLITTVAKANALSSANINKELCGQITIAPFTTNEKIITSDKIAYLCGEIDTIKLTIKQKLLEIYYASLEEMNTMFTFYSALSNVIAKLDLVHSYAKVSIKNNYFKPIIVNENHSFLEMKELRHPIIEKIISGPYVPNDVTLNQNGLIVFGLNAAGKSSLAKAIALNILMAQIGCYTSSKLRYKPYAKIITRLSGEDDLFKNQSSFTVEMSELRTILRQADQNTLVLADEISRGSESISGAGITVSAVLFLLDIKCSFILSSHLHTIVDIPDIKELPEDKLRICHLSVKRDLETNMLIYERKLIPGSGSSVYGVLVAESLDLPKNFIDKAYEVVNYILKGNSHVVTPNTSKYNSKIYVDSCCICGKNFNLEVHHVKEQHLANANGFIGNMHKNNEGNLVVLCKSCHVCLHKNKQELDVLKTVNGHVVKLK